MLQKICSKLKHLLIEQIWRIQIIQGLYGVIVFTPLLILANSEKLQKIVPLPTYLLVVLGTPILIFCVWMAGFFLDKIVNYQQTHDTVANLRNPQIQELLERTKRIEEKFNKIETFK